MTTDARVVETGMAGTSEVVIDLGDGSAPETGTQQYTYTFSWRCLRIKHRQTGEETPSADDLSGGNRQGLLFCVPSI